MELFTVEEVAQLWRVQPEIVQAHVDARRLRGINIGIDEPQVRFDSADIADCLKILRGRSGGELAAAGERARLSLPGVYRLNIKPDSQGTDPVKFCLDGDQGIAGMGWPVKASSHLDWEQYRQLAAVEYPDTAWGSVSTLHAAPSHAAIWTRRDHGPNTRFYVGQVVGPWEYRNDKQARSADIVNVRSVIWHEVGGYDAVPDSIARAFTPLTFAPINQPEAVEFTEVLASQLVSDGIWEEIG